MQPTSPTSSIQVSELLPCPFCGDSANLVHWDSEVSVLCSNCNVRSAPFFAENEANCIAAWNTRQSLPQGDEVERVALALHAHEDSWNDIAWEYLPEGTQSLFEGQARAALAALVRSKPDDVREKYDQLIFAVGKKFDGETRHETALRYIRQAEQGTTAIGSQSIEGGEGAWLVRV